MTGVGGVYLAYPIDQRGPASLGYMFEMVEAYKRMTIEQGIVDWVFDPGDAFKVSRDAKLNGTLPRINRLALNLADLVVAFLPAGVASVGVPMEIDRALGQGKHVILFSDAKSWMLERPNGGRLYRYNDYDIDSIKDAVLHTATLEPDPLEMRTDYMPIKVDEGGQLPVRAYSNDAGLDLFVSEDVTIPLGEFRDVPCGVSVELPEWSWALVTGRSSAFRKRGLLVLPGVIDAGYRGPIFAGVWAQREDVHIKAGERVAQMIIMGNSTRRVQPIEVQRLSQSERGSNGFGSSGE